MSGDGRWRRMYFMTPTLRPVGGVVKIFDYVNHAVAAGYEPVIASPEKYKAGSPLFEISRFSHLTPDNGVRFIGLEQAGVGPDDLAFISWPSHYPVLEPRIGRGARHEQVISIVQNVRWANPTFERGYAVRLLARPMARIMTNDVVLEACKPYLNETSMTEVIMLGNDSGFFAKQRSGGFRGPVNVGYTTWKSDVGDRVAAMLGRKSGFRFRAIRNPVGWKELKKLYQWSDVFLATPLVEEGFYMPGLEAMAAGAVVISPDAGGNRAYCRFGENCLRADLDDANSYAAGLRSLKGGDPNEVERLRRGGYDAVGRHTLGYERDRFGAFMRRLTARLDQPGPGGRTAGVSRGGIPW